MTAFTGVGVVLTLAGGLSVGCLNIGQAFTKLFLIIKLMGKFIFLPILFKGTILTTIYSLAVFSGHFMQKSELIFKKDNITHGLKTRYWFKFHLYKEYNNIL